MCIRDRYEEERLGGKSFGSTKSGIAPFYSDKYAKIGFQVSELFEDEEALKEKAVSYTHLDVYKRQQENSSTGKGKIREFSADGYLFF